MIHEVGHRLHGEERKAVITSQSGDGRSLHLLRMNPFAFEELELLGTRGEGITGRDHAGLRIHHLQKLLRMIRLDPTDPEGVETGKGNSMIMKEEGLRSQVDGSDPGSSDLETPARPRVDQQVRFEPADEQMGGKGRGDRPDPIDAVIGVGAGESHRDLEGPSIGAGEASLQPVGGEGGIEAPLILQPQPTGETGSLGGHREEKGHPVDGTGPAIGGDLGHEGGRYRPFPPPSGRLRSLCRVWNSIPDEPVLRRTGARNNLPSRIVSGKGERACEDAIPFPGGPMTGNPMTGDLMSGFRTRTGSGRHPRIPSRVMATRLSILISLIVACGVNAGVLRSEDDLRQLEDRFIEVVEKANPAVVRITTGGRSSSMATGVIFDSAGLVLTAGHVVRGNPRRLMIVLPDGERHRGRVVSSVFEDDVDLAVIEMLREDDEEPTPFAFSPLAPAGSLQMGEWIVTLGHAAAISSNGSREPATRIGRIIDLEGAELAMDSPIDAGDSGGPILDLEGRIVGIASRCGHQPWQNLATSVDAIHAWMPHLMDPEVEPPSSEEWEGRTRRKSSTGTRRDPEFLAKLDSIADPASSMLVEIRDDDRLVSLGTIVDRDLVITKASQFARHIRTPRVIRPATDESPRLELQARPIGLDSTIDLVLLEVPGLSDRLEVETIEPRTDPLRSGSLLVIPKIDGGSSGIAAVARDQDELSSRDASDDRPFLGVGTEPSRNGGLRVIRIVPNTAAARANLEVDDIIVRADGRDVRRTADLVEAITNLGIGDELRIEVLREDRSFSIGIDLGLRPDANRAGISSNTSIGTSRLSSGLGPIHLVDADRPLDEVGGAVIDAEGRLAGWLAARRSRTSMVVVPWDLVSASIAAFDDPESPSRRDVIERLCSYRIVGTADLRGIIRLDAEDAFPDGDVIRRERMGPGGRTTWGSWKDSDDALEWAIRVDQPGRWHVRLTTACPKRHAGTPIRLSVGEAFIDGRIERTDNWDDFRQFDLGVLDLEDTGEFTLRLEPMAEPRHAIGNLLGIELRRLADDEEDGGDAEDPVE